MTDYYETDKLCDICGARLHAIGIIFGSYILMCPINHPKPQMLNWIAQKPARAIDPLKPQE